jgi:hypothetical protein
MSTSLEILEFFSSLFPVSQSERRAILRECAAPTWYLDESEPLIVALTSVSDFIDGRYYDFAVPQELSHWGVVCRFPTTNTHSLFHLIYDMENQRVSFQALTWQPPELELNEPQVRIVGMTRYGLPEIIAIGEGALYKTNGRRKVSRCF